MEFLYNIGIKLYRLAIGCASLRNKKAKLWIEGRKNIWSHLKSNIDPRKKYIWFHCASLGEFEQGRPMIERIKSNNPNQGIIVTFYSPSGYEVRKNYDIADIVTYLPLDTRLNAQKFIQLIKPQKVIFVKYDFWHHFLKELHHQKIPTYIISAIFRKEQVFFKTWGTWFKKDLEYFNHLYLQNKESYNLLNSIGITHCSITGDTRFDRVWDITQQGKKLEKIEAFSSNKDKIVVIGSSWPKDDELLIKYINQNKQNIGWIIAPHEIDNEKLDKIQSSINKKSIRYSNVAIEDLSRQEILIIDGYGYLTSVYQYAHVAYIGGGFGIGIHNILEAATFGMPIIFGPNYYKFKEAVDLTSVNGAFSIGNYEELENRLENLLKHEQNRKKSGQISKQYIEKNIGATAHIIKEIFSKK